MTSTSTLRTTPSGRSIPQPLERVITVDTHVLLWLRADYPKLGRRAAEVLDRAHANGSLAVSSIVFAEAIRLHLRGRIDLGMPPTAWAQECADSGLHVIAVTTQIAVESSLLANTGFHGDPMDRIIAATAMVGGHSLMTADSEIAHWAERTRQLAVLDPLV